MSLEEMGFLQPGVLCIRFEACDTKPGPGGFTSYMLYTIRILRTQAAAVVATADASDEGGAGGVAVGGAGSSGSQDGGGGGAGGGGAGGGLGETWLVQRRFSDFEWLHERLQLVYVRAPTTHS